MILILCVLSFTGTVFAADFWGSAKLSSADVSSSLETGSTCEESVGNEKIQNAILQVDDAQNDIRNHLLDLKTKYADVDAQYISVKTERKSLKKQLRAAEHRLKTLDRAKDKMQRTK